MRGAHALRLLRARLCTGAQHQLSGVAPGGCNTWLAASGATQLPAALAAAAPRRGAATSPASGAAAAAAASAQPTVQGDVSAVLAEVDSLVSREDAGPKDVADAALALAYLQARGDRRLWGKIFERASATKADFDAASLTAFLWAATTAGVQHFKTAYELAGPASKLLPSLSADQLATVVEALGGAGVNDAELFKAVSTTVVAKANELTASQLAKVLWGFASAGVADGAVTKAVLGALGGKAGAAASTRDLAQLVTALAKLGRADAGPLSQLSKALAGKAAPGDAPSDVLAALAGFAHLNHKPDAALLTKAAAAAKAALPQLTLEQQIDAAWSLALLGGGDKDVFGSLFGSLGTALSAAPDSVGVAALARLAEAQLLAADRLGAGAPGLPPQVAAYAGAMHRVAADAAKERAGPAGREFRAAVATATARASGARYKPEIAAAKAALPKSSDDGLAIDYALDALKVAVLPVDASGLSSSSPRTPLGPAAATAALLKARGYAPAFVPAPEFNAQPDDLAKAKFVLAAIKAATGGSSQITALERKLAEPFNPYAD